MRAFLLASALVCATAANAQYVPKQPGEPAFRAMERAKAGDKVKANQTQVGFRWQTK